MPGPVERIQMPHQVNRRQKPVWKQVRRPLPPPGKPQSTKKGGKAYSRKDQDWKKGATGEGS